jgi:hypothetical protein
MKVLICDGATIEARDVGEPIITLRALPGPSPFRRRGRWLAEDADARAELRALLDSGRVERV